MRSLMLALVSAALIVSPAYATAPVATGNDISYPQCGSSYPSGAAFGIVGVNGGKASNFNPCFASELAWAQKIVSSTVQPNAQLYVNTGNPADVLVQYNVQTWPTSGYSVKYGTCSGTYTDDLACSYQYGVQRTNADISFSKVAPASFTWWLDVETTNSWTNDPAKNRAALEGMADSLTAAGAKVGAYSTSAQWSSIVGTVPSASTLYNLKEWRPGASNLTAAKSNCRLPSFTGGGSIVITQYVSGNRDYDYSCQ